MMLGTCSGLSASGCGNAADEPGEPVGQSASALCLLGSPCTGSQGLCTGTGTCNSSGVCVVSVWCDDGNPCKADSCTWYGLPIGYACSHTNVTNGTSCSDGNACTQTDTCQSGTCTGSNPVTCTGTYQCRTCNPSTGACSVYKTNGTSCSDGNACTLSDTCQSGACQSGSAKVCTDTQCQTCNTTTGNCDSKSNGTTCNFDSSLCTQSDSCQSGVCTAGTQVTCTGANQCKTCNPGTGTCSVNKTNGTGCNDANGCTQTDTCQSGTCTGGNPVVCSNPCKTCNSSSGACTNNASDGTACDDWDECYGPDQCWAGNCYGQYETECYASDQCHNAGVCDSATGMCSNPAKANGSSCTDNNGCTTTDTCQGGACSPGPAYVCPAAEVCHETGVCSNNNGSPSCTYAHKAVGTSCNDSDACTENTQCNASGVCTGGTQVNCDDGNGCTEDSCDHVLGCLHNESPDTTSCNDNKSCTVGDHCDGAGTCVGTVSCDDSNLCTADGCNAGGSCYHNSVVTCTAQDDCHEVGVCQPGTGTCTNPVSTNGKGCDDHANCTHPDSCQNGACVGTPVVCPAENECHEVGTCNPTDGTCSHVHKANGSYCSDGDPCWVGESCQSGVCSGGSAYACPAPPQCHSAGTCTPNPNNGFAECTYPNEANGTSCDDDNKCTQTDTCQAGTCTGSNPIVCVAKDQCHVAGTCNPSTGVCTDPYKPNGSSCTDNNGCTQSDSCQAGVCVGNDPIVCDADGNPCTSDACSPAEGSCEYLPEPASHGCNDGNLCTGSDHCDGAGQCVGGPANTGLGCDDQNACTGPDACTSQGACAGAEVNKDDANPCTEDLCDPMSGVWHANRQSGTECGDGNPLDGDELCNASGVCVEGTMGKPVLPVEEAVIERRLGTGRHPVAANAQRMAVAFVEMMKDAEAAPRIGVATFSLLGESKGFGRFDASVIDSGPVLAGLPDGGFAMAYTSLGEKDGDGLDVVLRTVYADGVISSTKVFANKDKSLGQRAADIVWADNHLVVGWEDESIAGIRQVCWRAFSDKLAPLGAAECDGDKMTASSLTLAASGTEVAKAWRKEGANGPSVEVEVPGGRRSFALAEASPSGAPALAAVGSDWMVVYTEGCGVQQAAIVNDAGDVLSQTPLGTGTPERYEPSLAVTQAGIYLSWREPAELVGGVWGVNLDEVYLQQHSWASNLLTPGAKVPVPAGTALLQGDQANAAIAAVPVTDDGALVAAWEDWNPNVNGHSKHGDVLVSLIVTPVVR